MAVRGLSEKERTVLLYSMRYPEHSDTELSRHADMNLFTFNKVKNSLRQRGLLRKFLVPNYGSLGFEIISTFSGSNMEYMQSPTSRDLLKERMREEKPGKLFFSFLEAHQGMGMLVAEDFTALRRAELNKRRIQAELNIPSGDIELRSLSLRDVVFKRFFDLYPLMIREYGDGITIADLGAVSEAQKAVETTWEDFLSQKAKAPSAQLSEVETTLLNEIVRSPSARDQVLCRNMGISRYRIRRIKDELFGRGLIKSLHIPSLGKLGYEVMMFTSLSFVPDMDIRSDMKKHWANSMPNVIFMAFDDVNGIGLGVFPDLSSASLTHGLFQKALTDLNLLEEDMRVQFFSIPNGVYDNWFRFQDPLITKGVWSLADLEGKDGRYAGHS
ncbi:MAG: hypothetical protein KAH57_08105 [Thermoplasmata archaeon]|nr:hypothetical protein [Thermoplasmata archaeon]